MKVFSLLFMLTAATGAALLQGCVKDHCTHSALYKVYTPHYLSMAEVRATTGPEAPRALEKTGKLFYHNGYLFIGEANQGIHIIDDRDPAAPRNIGFLNIPGNLDMTVSGNILYADNYVDMVSFDITDPSNSRPIGREENVFPIHTYGYAFSDDPSGKGMITGFTVSDSTIDRDCSVSKNTDVIYTGTAVAYSSATQSSSSAPKAVSQGGSTSRFAVQGHYLYAVQQDSMSLYNIADPAHPAYLNNIPLGFSVETIYPYQQYLFIGAPQGVLIYDASDPGQPVFLSQFSHVFACDPVVAQGHYAYATLRSGSLCMVNGSLNQLLVIDISNLKYPQLLRQVSMTNPGGLAVNGNDLIVTDGAGGIRFLNLKDPEHPEIVHTLEAPKAASDVMMVGQVAIVVADDGVYQYNYENMESPRLLSKMGISPK